MTSQAERTSPPGQAQPSREGDDRDAFAEMFEAHARHLFDYCYSLLGDRARAVSATQVTLIAAHSLASRLKDTGRMRAFVLALGRWECLSGEQPPAGAAEPDASGLPGTEDLATALAFVDQADDGLGDAETGELTLSDFEAASGLSLRAILAALPLEDREILDLLYRHDVSIGDLGPLLGVQAGSVPRMLASAKAKFAAQASETLRPSAAGLASPDVRADQLSAVRLLTLPAAVWRRTARVIMDPRFSSYRDAVSAHAEHLGPDGFPVQPTATPSGRKLLLSSALMAGLLLAPAAVGGVGYAAFSAISHVVGHQHSSAVTPGGPTAGGSSTGGTSRAGLAGSAGGAKRSGSNAKGNPGPGLLPTPRGSASGPTNHKSSSSPAPTSRYSSSSSPSPTQTATSPTSPTSSAPPSSSPPSSPSPTPTQSSSPSEASTAAASGGSTPAASGSSSS
ncbi:MAG TPA: sigma-70 family RNA polymerase sigma factor [Streptosporangiaceae bacterium]|nr:sigma-70 family RNA polymerase sigma factor [Streptosporangiaceae bacterium]